MYLCSILGTKKGQIFSRALGRLDLPVGASGNSNNGLEGTFWKDEWLRDV